MRIDCNDFFHFTNRTNARHHPVGHTSPERYNERTSEWEAQCNKLYLIHHLSTHFSNRLPQCCSTAIASWRSTTPEASAPSSFVGILICNDAWQSNEYRFRWTTDPPRRPFP
jgi:hypothetical protein